MTTQENITLEAFPRQSGKGQARSLRRDKDTPAVVYGPKVNGLPFSLLEKEVVKYSKHHFENTIFTLKSSDPKLNGLRVLRKAIDVHPVSRRPMHVDFIAPDMTKEVRVNLELRFEGKAKGTLEGGVVNIIKRDIEVECLPTAIPEFISVDISHLDVDGSIHVSDLSIPPGVELITAGDETVVTCAVVAEEPATPAAGAPAEGAAAGGTETAAPAEDKK